MLALYGGKPDEKLGSLRYEAYCRMSLSRCFQPERSPPSESAARMHTMRVHYQVVIWSCLDDCDIDPTCWGWKMESYRLVPIQIDGEIAPENVLKVVRCNCRGDCSSALCSCRKHGLHCVSACGKCHGADCSNIRVGTDPSVDADTSDSENETDCATNLALDDPSVDWPQLFLGDIALYEKEI